jgi:hypothetical protein
MINGSHQQPDENSRLIPNDEEEKTDSELNKFYARQAIER